jgi:hypothetical protein
MLSGNEQVKDTPEPVEKSLFPYWMQASKSARRHALNVLSEYRQQKMLPVLIWVVPRE